MPDDTFSIKEMLQEFRADFTDKFDNPRTGVYARLDKIDEKQAIANGRTTKSEMKIDKLQWWRNGIIWCVGTFIVLAPLVVSLIKSQIRSTVVEILADPSPITRVR